MVKGSDDCPVTGVNCSSNTSSVNVNPGMLMSSPLKVVAPTGGPAGLMVAKPLEMSRNTFSAPPSDENSMTGRPVCEPMLPKPTITSLAACPNTICSLPVSQPRPHEGPQNDTV